MNLGPLYHWSPAERYESILRGGLVAGSPATVASSSLPKVCLSSNPQDAWRLSGAMDWVSEIDTWDLWQVRLADTDAVFVRAEWGPHIHEIQVGNSIPPDRIWHAGRRSA